MSITPLDEPHGALAAFGVLAGPLIGKEVPVRTPVVGIGRGAQSDIVIDDDSVSASHARLEWDHGAWRLTDLESVNGTYVESTRLAPHVPTPLPYGASVRFGGIRMQFREVEASDPESARASYVEPEPEPSIRDSRTGFRFPVWALVLLLLVAALVAAWFLWPDPVTAPADPRVIEAPASASATPQPIR